MIFKDFLKQVGFAEIEKAMMKLYPDQEDNLKAYKKVYLTLLNKEPKLPEEPFKIWAHLCHELLDETKTYISISGRSDNPEDPNYALEYSPWNEWLGWNMDETNLKEMDWSELAAHILWEMTYCGFKEEDVQEDLGELIKRINEVENGTVKFKTLDEVIEELDIDFEDEEEND